MSLKFGSVRMTSGYNNHAIYMNFKKHRYELLYSGKVLGDVGRRFGSYRPAHFSLNYA